MWTMSGYTSTEAHAQTPHGNLLATYGASHTQTRLKLPPVVNLP
jgi:hypothetical protein